MRQINKVKVTLIRHAQSRFNQAQLERGFESVMFLPELIDAELTELGIKQTQEVGKQLKHKHYDVVFVSPLTRTLQTATYVFEENVGKPKFVAVPHLHEMLVSAGEIGGDYHKKKKIFNHVDFHMMDKLQQPEFWYLDCIHDLDWRTAILAEAKKQNISEFEEVGRFILKSLQQSPLFPETLKNLSRRIQDAKNTIKNYVAENGSDKNYALVAHYLVLEELTRTKDQPGIPFENCQVVDHILD